MDKTVAQGEYEVLIGSSSEDIKLKKQFFIVDDYWKPYFLTIVEDMLARALLLV